MIRKIGIVTVLFILIAPPVMAQLDPQNLTVGKVFDSFKKKGSPVKPDSERSAIEGYKINDLVTGIKNPEGRLDLGAKGIDHLVKNQTGFDSSPFTSAAVGLFGAIQRKSVGTGINILATLIGGLNKKAVKNGTDGDDDDLEHTAPGRPKDDAELDSAFGAAGQIIPQVFSKVAKERAEALYGGTGGGGFGVNPAIQETFLSEQIENQAIKDSIDATFSEEGQTVIAQFQKSVEENSAQASVIAEEAAGMKSSLDVSKAITSQFRVIANNQNSQYLESVQGRVATVQGNQLRAKLLKLASQKEWDEQIAKKQSQYGGFSNATNFAAMVESGFEAEEK